MLIVFLNTNQIKSNELFMGIPLEVARILIPVLVTISLFAFGHLINWTVNKIKKRREVIANRRIILEWIGLIIPPMTYQANQCRLFANNTKFSKIFIIHRLERVLVLTHIIEDLGFKAMSDCFIFNVCGDIKNNSILFYDFIHDIGYHKNFHSEINDKYLEYHKICNSLTDLWNEKIKLLNNLRIELLRKLSSNTQNPDNEFIYSFNNIYTNWFTKNSELKDMYKLKEDCLNVILKLSQEAFNKSRENVAASAVALLILDLNIIIRDWRKVSDDYHKIFFEYGYNLIKTLNMMNQKGITIVFVTHDPDLAAKGKRVIELKDGEQVN